MSKTKHGTIHPSSGPSLDLKVEYDPAVCSDAEAKALLDEYISEPDTFAKMARGHSERWQSSYGNYLTIQRTGLATIKISK